MEKSKNPRITALAKQATAIGLPARPPPARAPMRTHKHAHLPPPNHPPPENPHPLRSGEPDALPALLRRAGYSRCVIAKILFDLARM